MASLALALGRWLAFGSVSFPPFSSLPQWLSAVLPVWTPWCVLWLFAVVFLFVCSVLVLAPAWLFAAVLNVSFVFWLAPVVFWWLSLPFPVLAFFPLLQLSALGLAPAPGARFVWPFLSVFLWWSFSLPVFVPLLGGVGSVSLAVAGSFWRSQMLQVAFFSISFTSCHSSVRNLYALYSFTSSRIGVNSSSRVVFFRFSFLPSNTPCNCKPSFTFLVFGFHLPRVRVVYSWFSILSVLSSGISSSWQYSRSFFLRSSIVIPIAINSIVNCSSCQSKKDLTIDRWSDILIVVRAIDRRYQPW